MAAHTRAELTHEELWDDSDLVQNWNEAFEEYKQYHSLAARGEKVEKPVAKKSSQNGFIPSDIPVNFTEPAARSAQSAATQVMPGPASAPQTTAAPLPSAPPGLAALPQTLLSSTQDEALRNIMMSWYYAGYYTGLYEGQQKAWASMQEQQQEG